MGSASSLRRIEAGYPELFWRPADGTGSDEPLLTRAMISSICAPTAGRRTASSSCLPRCRSRSANQCAIGQIAIERPSEAHVLMKSDFCNDWPAVSPDGNWMAYGSNVSGRYEIYIERYLRSLESGSQSRRAAAGTQSGRVTVANCFSSARTVGRCYAVRGAGRRDGRRRASGYVVRVRHADGWPGARPYDVAPDGRFVMIRSGETDAGGAAASNMILMQNWFEELKRLVPTN